MALYDKASLVLIPSGTKEGVCFSQKPTNGDGDFTFSRSTSATRVGPSGYIEKETQNLLLQSNSFDTTWNIIRSSVTSGVSDPFGGSNAWSFLTDNTADDQHYISQVISQSGVGTLSIYAKANGYNWLRMRLPSEEAYFDLANGVTGSSTSGISASMTDVGSGWYRCEVAISDMSTNPNIFIHIAEGDGDIIINGTPSGTDGVYIYAAQLEQGLVARDYIETTTSAVYGGITDNIPRLDYTDSSCPSLLLEPQRTNLVTQSEYFANSSWQKLAAGTASIPVVTSNQGVSPDGGNNASKVVFNRGAGTTSNDYSRLYFSSGSAPATASVYVKSFDGTEYDMYLVCGNAFESISVTNEWQRFDVTESTSGSNIQLRLQGNLGSESTAEVLVYGAQLEEGSYATSYIPTYGASVTRVGDSCIITSATDLIGQTEGTLFLDVNFDEDGGVPSAYPVFINVDSSASNRFGILRNPNDKIHMYMVTEGVTQFTTDTTQTSGRVKIAYAYANNDVAIYVNGTSLFTSNSVSIPSTDKIGINRYGFTASSGYNTKSNVNNTMLFKTRLSNEELADLTQV